MALVHPRIGRLLVLLLLVCCSAAAADSAAPFSHGPLKVSSNHRFLVHADGTPFFYLADTAWELFHRLNREDAERYLDNRRQKRFTVIQAVALAELDGLATPNAYGELPLAGRDPTRPNNAYFEHVDWIVNKAREKGLYVGFLPTWGNKVVKGSWEETAPIIFNSENARVYGQWIGRRYKDVPNIIWILGGDRDPVEVEGVWRAMAEGLRAGDGGAHLITFHPNGGSSSSKFLHNEPWLDFNMLQSGHHARDIPNFRMIAHDYALLPTKPVLDGESRYEDHPVNWQPDKLGWFDDFDVREGLYWAVFAGGLGQTYGCHPVWQMLAPGREPVGHARHYWYDVLDLPGAQQVKHLRALMESRPFLSRVPDQSLLADNPEEGPGHAQATRGDGYILVYLPAAGEKPVRLLNTRVLPGRKVVAWWFNPRSGGVRALGTLPNEDTVLSPPGPRGRGRDWVFVLDEAARKFPAPGAAFQQPRDR